MKKLLILLISILVAVPTLFAQKTIRIDGYNDEEIHTVFKRNKRDGFYGSFATGYSPIDNKHALVANTRAGWILDHWFAFGATGSGFVNNIDNLDMYSYSSYSSDNEYSLAGGYGGIFIEPMLYSLKPIHLSFPVIFAIGGAGRFNNAYYYADYTTDIDVFYVIEPGIELEMNFTKWMRIALYGTYRYTPDISIMDISPDALRSYSVGVNFKIGLF
ncbi:MAG: hypothetical protein ACERKD_09470 [Prolixibacteraceae bacterium]